MYFGDLGWVRSDCGLMLHESVMYFQGCLKMWLSSTKILCATDALLRSM